MNEVFSSARFGKLFIKHTADHYRSYLMSIAVVAGVLILGGFFISYIAMGLLNPAGQTVLFFFLLVLAGTIFTSTIFNDLGEKKKSIPTLLLPASTLEKFLVGWLYSYVLFILVFTGMYYFALVAVIYFQTVRGDNEQMMMFFNYKTLWMFVLFSFCQSVALFGSVLFEKLHFIKTAFCFFIAIGLIILLNTLWLKGLTGKDVAPAMPFSSTLLHEGKSIYVLSPIDEGMFWVMWVIITITIFFWIAAYFRLREKRV